jgi:hypothetical protein
MGILDNPQYSAKYHIRYRGKDKRTIDCDIRFFKPAIDEKNSSYKNNGIRERLDDIIWLLVPDGIDVVFVYEITNHP